MMLIKKSKPIIDEIFGTAAPVENCVLAQQLKLVTVLGITLAERSRSQNPTRISPSTPLRGRLLKLLWGFTNEELDDLINYDIKYRMGRDSES